VTFQHFFAMGLISPKLFVHKYPLLFETVLKFRPRRPSKIIIPPPPSPSNLVKVELLRYAAFLDLVFFSDRRVSASLFFLSTCYPGTFFSPSSHPSTLRIDFMPRIILFLLFPLVVDSLRSSWMSVCASPTTPSLNGFSCERVLALVAIIVPCISHRFPAGLQRDSYHC